MEAEEETPESGHIMAVPPEHYVYKAIGIFNLEKETEDGWEFVELIPEDGVQCGEVYYSDNQERRTNGFSYKQHMALLRRLSTAPDVAALNDAVTAANMAREKEAEQHKVETRRLRGEIQSLEDRLDERSNSIAVLRKDLDSISSGSQLRAETLEKIKNKLGTIEFEKLVMDD